MHGKFVSHPISNLEQFQTSKTLCDNGFRCDTIRYLGLQFVPSNSITNNLRERIAIRENELSKSRERFTTRGNGLSSSKERITNPWVQITDP